ncbi:hypothetical protein HDU84_006569 [Entophlyctis sp. JEL0112]|nr:hypothetical protein HDU84_006569 [Entophlyctis sp. JEL0112]
MSSAAGSARVAKHRLVVVGSGWAGFRVLQSVDSRRFDVTLVSLRNHFVFTPLLASTAVGTLEFRCVTEPVKRVPNVQFFEAKCDTVDFANKRVHCSSSFEGFSRDSFSVQYDSLVLAIGAVSNTFNIPGVAEHALFLKDVNDARKIRSRIMECFEHASQPNISDAEKAKLLHFAVVGGGPTGVEFLAELHDFITEDVISLYPDLRPFLSMSINEAGKKILGAFDDKLSQYAGERFKRKGIELKLGQAVKEVKAGSFVLTTGEVVHYGMLVWSTGLSPVDLVKKLTSGDSEIAGHPVLQKEQQGMGRLVTDHYFRVLDTKGNALQNVFALGDCATVKDRNLPCTAQVANQKGAWLAKGIIFFIKLYV